MNKKVYPIDMELKGPFGHTKRKWLPGYKFKKFKENKSFIDKIKEVF